jgi:hypothetical protein
MSILNIFLKKNNIQSVQNINLIEDFDEIKSEINQKDS